MTVHQRRLKIIQFTIAGVAFDAQITSWKIQPGFKPGNRVWTYNSAGEGQNSFIEDVDGDPTIDIKFVSDWTSGGLSDYLASNALATAAFQLDHHPDIVGEHVRWSGSVVIYPPDSGDAARLTEVQEVVLPIVGTAPTYARIG